MLIFDNCQQALRSDGFDARNGCTMLEIEHALTAC
jgi:hypothetical protein